MEPWREEGKRKVLGDQRGLEVDVWKGLGGVKSGGAFHKRAEKRVDVGASSAMVEGYWAPGWIVKSVPLGAGRGGGQNQGLAWGGGSLQQAGRDILHQNWKAGKRLNRQGGASKRGQGGKRVLLLWVKEQRQKWSAALKRNRKGSTVDLKGVLEGWGRLALEALSPFHMDSALFGGEL